MHGIGVPVNSAGFGYNARIGELDVDRTCPCFVNNPWQED